MINHILKYTALVCTTLLCSETKAVTPIWTNTLPSNFEFAYFYQDAEATYLDGYGSFDVAPLWNDGSGNSILIVNEGEATKLLWLDFTGRIIQTNSIPENISGGVEFHVISFNRKGVVAYADSHDQNGQFSQRVILHFKRKTMQPEVSVLSGDSYPPVNLIARPAVLRKNSADAKGFFVLRVNRVYNASSETYTILSQQIIRYKY